jgi:two-component system, NarL family, nitrate/nitrite response regulator NarL
MRSFDGEAHTIVLVGDDALARSAIRAALEREGLVTVVGEGALDDAAELLALGAEVVVWDAGPAARTSPPAEALSLPTLVLVEPEAEARRLFREAGLSVVQRGADADALSAAVVATRAGLQVLDRAFTEERQSRGGGELLVEPLTPRELEVLALLADGLSNRRIAKRLEISEHTVKFHVNAILLKLDADSRTGAVVTAARLGLLHL